MKTLGWFSDAFLPETGKIKSAGVTESSAVKKEAVKVTLYAAV